MADLEAMLKQLDTNDCREKESVLIDLLFYFNDPDAKLNDKTKLFVEVSKVRDSAFFDGTEAYFEDNEEGAEVLNLLQLVLDNPVFAEFERLCRYGKYEEIDEWIVNNEAALNDELAKLIIEAIHG